MVTMLKLDVEIKRTSLTTQIKILYREISRLQKSLNELTPIHSLSPELLALIFGAVEAQTKPGEKKNVLCRLMSVSHHWGSVVIEAPKLWASIVWTPSTDARWMSKCIQRVKHVDTLSLSTGYTLNMPWEAITPIFPRFREIVLNNLHLPEGDVLPASLQKLSKNINASRSIQTIDWVKCQYFLHHTDFFLRFLPSSLRMLSFTSGYNLTSCIVYQALAAAPFLNSLRIFNDNRYYHRNQDGPPVLGGHHPLIHNYLRDLNVITYQDPGDWVALIGRLRLPTNADIQLCIFDEDYHQSNQNPESGDAQLQFEHIKQAIGGSIPSIKSISILEKRCQSCVLYEVRLEYHAGAPGRGSRSPPAFTQFDVLVRNGETSGRSAPLEHITRLLPSESLQNMRSLAYYPLPQSDGDLYLIAYTPFPNWFRELIRLAPNLRSISLHHPLAVYGLAAALQEVLPGDFPVDGWMLNGPCFPLLDELSIGKMRDLEDYYYGSWDRTATACLTAAIRGRTGSGRRILRKLTLHDGTIRAHHLSALEALVEELVVGAKMRIIGGVSERKWGQVYDVRNPYCFIHTRI